MKHRSVLTVLLLSIITLGLYDLYWLGSTKQELDAKTSVKTPTLWLIGLPYVIGILFFVFFFVFGAIHGNHQAAMPQGNPYAAQGQVSHNQALPLLVIGLVEIVLALIIIPVTFFWFLRYSKAVNEYTKGEVSTVSAFLLLYVLRFIGIAFIQDNFNAKLESSTQTA